MLFSETQHEDHIATLNLACNNGIWNGSSIPLAPASGWYQEPSSDEEKYRFSMHSPDPKLIEPGYTYYLVPNYDNPWGEGGPTVLKFRDPPEDSLTWWPFGGW
jgi:hypothetical protein